MVTTNGFSLRLKRRMAKEPGKRFQNVNVDPRFTEIRPLGHGGNGVVFAAVDSDCDKAVAIKKLSFNDKKSCKYALREIQIIRRLHHENILTVYEILGPNGFSIEQSPQININDINTIYMVQELLHTDLHQLIYNEQLSPEHIQLFLYQILRGIKYIHSANVLHRDLKPANLLLNVEDMVLKIADFGLARVVDSDYCHKGFLTDCIGTCWYRSPELVVSPRDYTRAIDLWSVGCIFAEMLTAKPLFPGAHEMDQIGQILDSIHLNDNEWNRLTQILPHSVLKKHNRNPKYPLRDRFRDVDPEAMDLLEKLLAFSSENRLTAEEALEHPYLHKYSCPGDEPIVNRSFHVEHEVDDLSLMTLRQMITQEIVGPVESCGSVYLQSQSNLNEDDTETVPVTYTATVCDVPDNDADADNLADKNGNAAESHNFTLEFSDIYAENLYNSSKFIEVVVDLPDEENKKEQISPKEALMDEKAHRNKSGSQREKDRLNLERKAESPKGFYDKAVKNKGRDRHRSRTDGDRNSSKEKRKKNRNNKFGNSGNDSQDFDSLYRLPTEHLSHNRNGRKIVHRNVEEQLRLYEEFNEKLRLAELEMGAVGGTYINSSPNDLQEELEVKNDRQRKREREPSPIRDGSRESSPSDDDQLIQRRFEK
ncbi:hypothetical protein ScPMuIL_017740 [Solemya velum]